MSKCTQRSHYLHQDSTGMLKRPVPKKKKTPFKKRVARNG